ncbi:uridylate kinase [compost metagenome]
MDTAAFALARDNAMPIIVYALDDAAGLKGVLAGTTRSTRVGNPTSLKDDNNGL